MKETWLLKWGNVKEFIILRAFHAFLGAVSWFPGQNSMGKRAGKRVWVLYEGMKNEVQRAIGLWISRLLQEKFQRLLGQVSEARCQAFQWLLTSPFLPNALLLGLKKV